MYQALHIHSSSPQSVEFDQYKSVHDAHNTKEFNQNAVSIIRHQIIDFFIDYLL
jgi:hypothetical protein